MRRIPGLSRLVRRLRNPDLHALRRSQRGGSTFAVLQPWTTTAKDRYPALFDALARELAEMEQPRVLSFGCAGGEEVRALRQRMPNALIVGVDVNPRALARARRKDRHKLSHYVLADRPAPGETFDAILTLAVFRHGELERAGPDDCSAVLPFAQVEQVLERLDAALLPGGLLAYGNAHFRLEDVQAMAEYRLEAAFAGELDRPRVLYGPDNRRILGAAECGGLYRKPA